MIRYIDSHKMGRGEHSWLNSYFHFSFAEYHNADNIKFGVLRVLNDDMVQPQTGFDTHPHQNMEIVSYVVQGELTHGDSMGNHRTLTCGQVQYMSAGTGVLHSEQNFSPTEVLRFIQIWIFPDNKGYSPNYGDHLFKLEDRFDKWLHIATSVDSKQFDAPIRIHQDVNIFATIISDGGALDFEVKPERQAYLVLVEGRVNIEDIHLNMRDAAEITEQNITINALEKSHILIIEMAKQ